MASSLCNLGWKWSGNLGTINLFKDGTSIPVGSECDGGEIKLRGKPKKLSLGHSERERERGDEVRLTGTHWKKRIARQREILPRSSGFTCGKLE